MKATRSHTRLTISAPCHIVTRALNTDHRLAPTTVVSVFSAPRTARATTPSTRKPVAAPIEPTRMTAADRDRIRATVTTNRVDWDEV